MTLPRFTWVAIAALSLWSQPAPLQADRVDTAATPIPPSLEGEQRSQEESAIRSAATNLQMRFEQAESTQQYTAVRDEAKHLQARAARLGVMDLAFECAVLAADAAYFRSSARDAPAAEKDHPLAALEDLLVAFPLRRHAAQRAGPDRLVGLTVVTLRTALARRFPDNDKIQAALKRLAPLVDQSIRPDFNYGDPTVGNLRKAIDIARELADLSYRYGDAEIASSRMAIAEQRADELGDTGLVLSLMSSRYDGERTARAAPLPPGHPLGSLLREAMLSHSRDKAWQRAQDLRNVYRSATGRIWAAYKSDALFGAMLKDELDDPATAPATLFARVESLRARMLLERLRSPGTTELRTARALELEDTVLSFKKPERADNSLTAVEMRLVSQLSNFETMGGGDEPSRSRALGALEDLYRGAGAGYRTTASTTTLAALQRTLSPDEALIEYVITNPLSPTIDLRILLITRDGFQVAHAAGIALDKMAGRFSIDGGAPVDSSALGNLIITTRTHIRSNDDRAARPGLAALYQLLLGPLAAQGFRPESFKRLVIVPHGALHYVPFAALLDAEGRFLISKTEIVVAPSASTWQLLTARQRTAGPLVVLANPDLRIRGVPGLPFADEEATAILKLMSPDGTRLFRAVDATRTNLFAEAPRAGILHLATHGDFPDENAANAHTLWLADEGGKSVALTTSDVRRLSLNAARLVVLSVCNGGLYRTGPSDEPYGLLPAFLEAGAPNVIGAMWRLDDEFGRNFMIEFYRQLQTHDAAGALRRTSLRFIGADESLRNWAAFVLVGSGGFD